MNEPMTDKRIGEITARCERVVRKWAVHEICMSGEVLLVCTDRSIQMPTEDAIFFAAVGTDIPDLLAEVARLNKDRGDLLANMLQSTTLSPSQVCEKYHLQNCHACERADCCDNVTPSIKRLKKELAAYEENAAKQRKWMHIPNSGDDNA